MPIPILPLLLLTFSAAAGDPQKVITLTKDANGPIDVSGQKYTLKQAQILGAGAFTPPAGSLPFVLAADCSGVPQKECNTVLAALRWATEKGGALTESTTDLRGTLTVSREDLPTTVSVITAGDTSKLHTQFTINAPAAAPGGSGTGNANRDTPPTDRDTAPTVTCDNVLGASGELYSAQDNRAQVVVTESGNVLQSGLSQFDEDDTLVVHVLTTVARRGSLVVRRTSEIRDLTAYRIAGMSSIRVESAEDCDVLTVRLHDFEPGLGQVEISLQESGTLTRLGLVEFNVHALYSGMLSFGAAWTSLPDPAFGTVSRDGRTLITRGQVGSHRLVYSVLFTPFIWGRRDLEKEPPLLSRLVGSRGKTGPESILRHFNPTLGLVVNDPLNNALVGISLDLFDGVVITGGVHVGRVKVLDPRSGLSVGSEFAGPADQIPTAQAWQVSPFWGVSLDVRAALQLVQAAFSPSFRR